MFYKQTNMLEDRKIESYRILVKYPDKIPIICEKHSSCKTIKEITKKKYLVSMNYTCGQFMYIIRAQLQLPAEHAMFFFIKDSIPSNTQTVGELYDSYKDEDGFLYIHYASENTFG